MYTRTPTHYLLVALVVTPEDVLWLNESNGVAPIFICTGLAIYTRHGGLCVTLILANCLPLLLYSFCTEFYIKEVWWLQAVWTSVVTSLLIIATRISFPATVIIINVPSSSNNRVLYLIGSHNNNEYSSRNNDNQFYRICARVSDHLTQR